MGCGLVADYGHIPAIKRTAGVELVSIMDPDAGRLLEAKSKFGVPNSFTDAQLFFQSGIDAVIITSPAPTHKENVLLAAKYRKPVLCEKPLSMNEEDSIEMIDAMSAAGAPLYVGFTYRFAPCAMEIHRLIMDGAIGKVRSLRLIYIWDCHGKYLPRLDANCYNAHREGRMNEGGPMVDCGVHQIDLARWWLGSEVIHSQGMGAWVDGDDHISPDHMYLHMTHARGETTMVEISYSYAHTSRDSRVDFRYELIGTDGIIRYDRQARVFELLNQHGTKSLAWYEEKNFDGMYQELERALRTGKTSDMPTGLDGMLATRIARTATEQSIKDRAKHEKPIREAAIAVT